MAQSYKTILRFFCPVCRLVLLLLLFFPATAAQQKQPVKAAATFQVLKHQTYRFSIPSEQAAETTWKFIHNRYGSGKLPAGFTSQTQQQNILNFYFDTKNQYLFNRNLMLRQRLFLTSDGRHEILQLLLPAAGNAASEIVFKVNKKPDKGKAFTNHPFLKLVRQ
jgi:hypothetical protein